MWVSILDAAGDPWSELNPLPTTATSANPSTNYGKAVNHFTVAQGAAGTTVIAAASPGNFHKITSGLLIMDGAGTLAITDGAGTLLGPVTSDGAGWGILIPANIMTWLRTSIVNTTLNVVTTGAKAAGFIDYLTEP